MREIALRQAQGERDKSSLPSPEASRLWRLVGGGNFALTLTLTLSLRGRGD